nr:DUF1566 domain-containing protein [Labrenzia sp. R5_0]
MPWQNTTPNLNTFSGAESELEGDSNTKKLSNGIFQHSAAKYCEELVSNGHDDWYLPAKEELGRLFAIKKHVSGLIVRAGSQYWASSEYSNIFAWSQNFHTGEYSGVVKNQKLNVHCIRSIPTENTNLVF